MPKPNLSWRAAELLRFLEPNPNLPPHLQAIAGAFRGAADVVLENAPPYDCANLELALQRLLEAKDAAVRARLELDRYARGAADPFEEQLRRDGLEAEGVDATDPDQG